MGNSVGKTNIHLTRHMTTYYGMGSRGEENKSIPDKRNIKCSRTQRSCIWLIHGMYERKLTGKKEEAKTHPIIKSHFCHSQKRLDFILQIIGSSLRILSRKVI